MFKLFKRKKKVVLKKYWIVVETVSNKKFGLTIEAVDKEHLFNKADAMMQEEFKIVDFGHE